MSGAAPVPPTVAGFTARHIGTDAAAQATMLAAVGYADVDELVKAAVPASIHVAPRDTSDIPPAATEAEALAELRELASQNRTARPMIGLGYYDTFTPSVIARNVLENPSWYTAYTPYQPEISQGRLEALINFQTMVTDLTGLATANASMLDESTAVVEGMLVARRASKSRSDVFLVDADALPQTRALLEHRAAALGIELQTIDFADLPAVERAQRDDASAALPEAFGAFVQYPGASGRVWDPADVVAGVHAAGGLVVAAADLLALTLLRSPGSFGADVAVGTTQRFGVPLGFGGPHAGYMAVRAGLERQLPGRLVGVSQDAVGHPAYRLSLQTREQHIRREKATSNICTAQVLLAVMAAMYAVYHGPDGLRAIAEDVAAKTEALATELRGVGLALVSDWFFDTIHVHVPGTADRVIERARALDIYPGETVAIVGESGSGKSTTASAVVNLLPGTGHVTAGSITLDGRELTDLNAAEMERVRGRDIGYVPQDPMSNLNPVWSIGFQVKEAVRANGIAQGKRDVEQRAIEVLKQAGLADAERRLHQYPHQFSGGMRQRALIGIGLAADPQLLIADEPTSALDVTVQRVILDHMASLTRDKGTSVLLITHDLGLAAERASRIVVMNQGEIVEAGPSREILENPLHPYTQRLVAAAPSIASQRIQARAESRGVETLADVTAPPVIEVRDLVKEYKIRMGGFRSEQFRAVDEVSFEIPRGKTLALVGESGSGKSTVAKLLLKLEEPTAGEMLVDGRSLSALSNKDAFALRRRMQPVFQDPYGSLDPLRNIGNTIAEPLVIHKVGDEKSRRARVRELLDQVSLPQELASRYANELSGGQRQRVAIARALALKPDIVILDEAVSALDVLVQDQVLQLLAELQNELDLTYLFITHDLAVVRVAADLVCVMERGKVVEKGTVDEIFANPSQEYTRRLLDAIPGASIPLGGGAGGGL